MASKWWLYIGIFVGCTGVGTPVGMIMIVIYFYDDIRKNFKFSQYNDNTYNINNLNVNAGGDPSKDDFDTPMDHMSRDAREEMR